VDEPAASWWARRRAALGTVRVRTTLAAAVIVGVALVAGALALLLLLRNELTDEVRAAAQLRADDVATALEDGASPEEVTASSDDDVLIQVRDEDGRVVASSPHLEEDLPQVEPGDSDEIMIDTDDEPFLAVGATAETSAGRSSIVVARTLETVAESTRLVGGFLVVGLPLLLAVVVFTTWKLVGRALKPVDAIRTEVDEISAAELFRRVPNPPGNDEIARLAATMNQMLDRLDRAQQQQRQFVSDASHELRSPVASIREQAEVALAHPERITTSALAEHVLAEDLRVQRLVEDLLLLARADEQILRVRPRPLDLDDLVFEEARRLRGTTQLRIDTSAVSAARVVGDAPGLRRVVSNLAENAVRHARSRVAFSLIEDDHTVVLGVDDDGAGIPTGERARVFERFVRLDDARARDAGGSGLGLAIVAEVVGAHRGSVSIVDSRLGGTRVEIRLPSPSAT
jgi:signal transduction histidine kinase